MATATAIRQTLDDLMRYDGKAELIGGRIVPQMPSDDLHGSVALEIAVSLREYVRSRGIGRAYGDSVGFRITATLPNERESFSPDAAYHASPPADRRQFVPTPPTFAVEVRSEGDYGPAAEREMMDKRADYFATGTVVIWDVDPDARLIRLFRDGDPQVPAVVFRDGRHGPRRAGGARLAGGRRRPVRLTTRRPRDTLPTCSRPRPFA